MRGSIEIKRLPMIGNAAAPAAKRYEVFFWEMAEGGFIRACWIDVMASHPSEALAAARGANPAGRGFKTGSSSEAPIPQERPRPPKRMALARGM